MFVAAVCLFFGFFYFSESLPSSVQYVYPCSKSNSPLQSCKFLSCQVIRNFECNRSSTVVSALRLKAVGLHSGVYLKHHNKSDYYSNIIGSAIT